jgi:hypothetical protein
MFITFNSEIPKDRAQRRSKLIQSLKEEYPDNNASHMFLRAKNLNGGKTC